MKKKFLVMSDSHGQNDLVQEVIDKESPIDGLIHCGDMEEAFGKDLSFPMYFVKGNCDSRRIGKKIPYERIIDVCGYKILICHGHLYDVKYSLQDLINEGISQQVDIICFGHTHIPLITKKKGILLLNPGSLAFPERGYQNSYIVLTFSENGIHYSLKEVMEY